SVPPCFSSPPFPFVPFPYRHRLSLPVFPAALPFLYAPRGTASLRPFGSNLFMQNKSRETLPKTLPGVILPQWVRCGRPNCRCARGHLHGPYHYRFWREGGRLRKAYVKQSEVEAVRARCEARRRAHRDHKAAWGTWRGLLAAVRQVEDQA